jgi:transposase
VKSTMSMDKSAAEQIYNLGKAATVAKLIELDTKNDELAARIEKLSKNSSNSSKPPSSDIVKPNRAERRRDKKKRAKGGQHSHPKWERQPFGPDEVKPIEYTLKSCPVCAGPLILQSDETPKIQQQVEIVTPAVEKLEHRGLAYWCARCKCMHYGAIPDEVQKQGLFKPHVASTVCFLKYMGCMSLSGIKKYLRDALDIQVTKGYLVKVIQKGSAALEACYDELLRDLPHQAVVNADETGWPKQGGDKQWTWVFRTSLYSLFKINPSRSSQVLIDVLGKEFNGVLGCDYFSAYRKFMGDFTVVMQFCLAHLIRDVKFLVDSHDPSLKRYGTKILDALRDLFHTIHKRDSLTPQVFVAQLEKNKQAVIKAATGYVPARGEAENMAKRFREHGHEYFTFITSPGVDPTNNCAEQAIRFVVIYRRVTQGTRSTRGSVACERFFTVIASCTMQGRSAFAFIKQALHHYALSLPSPSLLPLANSS